MNPSPPKKNLGSSLLGITPHVHEYKPHHKERITKRKTKSFDVRIDHRPCPKAAGFDFSLSRLIFFFIIIILARHNRFI